MWHAQQRAQAVMDDPAGAAEEQAVAAMAALEQVISKARGSRAAAQAQLALGSIAARRNQLAQAREAYETAVRNHSQFPDLAYAARAALLTIYAAQHDQAALIAMYRELMVSQPWSGAGLDAPLAIARAVAQRHSAEEASAAYQAAVKHYEKLINEAPSMAQVLLAKGQMVAAYEGLGQWERAMALLKELAAAERGVNRPVVLLKMAQLHETRFGEMEQAKALYRQVIDGYAGQPAAWAAAQALARLVPPPASHTAALPELLLFAPPQRRGTSAHVE